MAMPSSSSSTTSAASLLVPHSLWDDLQAAGTALLLLSLGLTLLGSAGLATGGTPGLAFLLGYASGWPLGPTLLLVNLPFYLLGWVTLGGRFTLRSLLAVVALAAGIELVRGLITVQAAPAFAALAGGVLIGTGLLVMFRHDASLGGVNILALYLQRRLGWSVGWVQLAIDLLILAGSCLLLDPARVAWSVLATVVLNGVLAWNHRAGRYRGGRG
ncbi:YitT family protein [Roseateles sp. DAIF2]|uniref:YitT family protein n=1 Tax=Roseateles sp. DAIF2 TaxID=2714952 RepID=UPI00201E6563|nr:YitT family protein [Roseateles sp. DAIF2]